MFRKTLCLFLVFAILTSSTFSVSASSLPFTDVLQNHTYYDAIKYVYDNNIMNGISATEFGCNNSLNRAMLVTILYRISGSYDLIDPVGFTDVPEGSFYYYAVGWGQLYGIINGIDDTTFGPSILVTNQQLVTFLYRYAELYEFQYYYLPEYDIITQFSDYSSIQEFAHDATNWAVNCGIVPKSTYFSPDQVVNRASCANYLYLFLTLALGNAKAFVSSDYEDAWNGAEICTSLNEAGHEATWQKRVSPLTVECSFYNNDIVYICSHGSDKYLNLQGGRLYYHTIDRYQLAATELVYLSACYAGGTFSEYLIDEGCAKYVIGFTGELRPHPNIVD